MGKTDRYYKEWHNIENGKNDLNETANIDQITRAYITDISIDNMM